MELTNMGVEIEFLEPALGTTRLDREVYRRFTASRAPSEEAAEEELESVSEDGSGKTGFPRLEDGTPFIWDYQV